MNWYKVAKKYKEENLEDYTQEMKSLYEKRTKYHIGLVQKYCKKIAEYDRSRFGKLIDRGRIHDKSKYEKNEKIPYIFITWKHHCKDNGISFNPSLELQDAMNAATEHHVLNNSHHPEFHSPKKTNIINKENRDKPPKEIVNATKMPELDIAEMVADWSAMSEEKGGTPKEWADDNVNVRWKFTDKQKNLIYELINAIW